MAAQGHRCAPERHKIKEGFDHVSVLCADPSDMAPLMVFSVNETEELLVVQQAVSPVEERFIEQVEQRKVAKELPKTRNSGEAASLMQPGDVDQRHHPREKQVASKNLEHASSVERGWRLFSIVDASVGEPPSFVG